MPGNYSGSVPNDPPIQNPVTLLHPVLNGEGGPIEFDYENLGFVDVPYRTISQEADFIRPNSPPGFFTERVSDCVCVAAMERNANNDGWVSYYFAHLDGSAWVQQNADLFNQFILNPQNTWIAVMSPRTYEYGLQMVLNAINETIPNGRGAIPAAQSFRYHSARGNFGFAIADGRIGEAVVRINPPKSNISILKGILKKTFAFPTGKSSSRVESIDLNPPPGANVCQIVLTGWEASYSGDSHYDFGALEVSVQAFSVQSIQATMELRDDNIDEREWSGYAEATVFFLQEE